MRSPYETYSQSCRSRRRNHGRTHRRALRQRRRAQLLLDIVPPDADGPARNKIAAAGLEAAKKSKPAAFFEPSLARLVTIGNFEDDLKRLSRGGLDHRGGRRESRHQAGVIEEGGSRPQAGDDRHHQHQRPAGGKIAEGFSDDFRNSWFGTHFFNPPRYMRLLEIIPTPETDHAAIDAVAQFCDVHLGKGVVFAKDTPNFIANRIGTFSVLNVMRLMQEMDLSIEDVDALTGDAVGWPKSATFRTIDLVGLDILGHVVGNMTKNVHEERSDPQAIARLLPADAASANGWATKPKAASTRRVWGGRPRPPSRQ